MTRFTVRLQDVRDGALLVEFPEANDDDANRAAVKVGKELRRAKDAGLLDAIPGARSLLVVFEPERLGREALARRIERASAEPDVGAVAPGRLVRIPVLYDGEDLAEVSASAGLSEEESARRHAAGRYRVAFVGFAPGFAYLAGLPAELATPRLSTPRPRVPAGSVAIGGPWTGVYPAASPGGWRLVGRTTVRLFDAEASPPSLLEPGDRVEFERVATLSPEASPGRATEPGGRLFARVLSPGLFTTIQGAPRPGLGSSGIPAGGAMDPVSLGLANALAGNPTGAQALELTWTGPELELAEEATLAVAGGEALIEKNGEPAPFAEAFRGAAGDRIRVGRVTRGARAYLAVRGGVAGEPGRRLEAGGRIERGEASSSDGTLPQQPPCPLDVRDEVLVRVLAGPEASRFPPASLKRFYATVWRVTPESDRRGLRLSGDPVDHAGPPEIVPSGTVPGSIQVPGSGLPIVLGPDGPVTGGYPRIATAISADLPLLGQARPGTILRFVEISLDEALSARRSRGSTITVP